MENSFGRRCLHELRCLCYPTMVYREQHGWNPILGLVGCPFCETQEPETMSHMLWSCEKWGRYRRYFLGLYMKFGEELFLKIVLGFHLSKEERKKVSREQWMETEIVNNMVSFIQRVDKLRSDILQSKGMDLKSKQPRRASFE